MPQRQCNMSRPAAAFRPWVAAILFIAAVVPLGCVSLGNRVGRAQLPAGAPKAGAVLADLAQNDEKIRTFRGAGTFTIESPDLEAIERFRGSIRFRRPADLYVQGNQRLTNIPIFKLTSVGQEFLMEFPGRRDQNFYQIQGAQFEDVPFSVSPSDIAKEMFLPERWGELSKRDVRIAEYVPETHSAVMQVGPSDHPRRIVELVRVDADQPRWVMKRDQRLSEDGRVLAETTLNDYHEIDGALFPAYIDAQFPTELTRMTFELRNVRINTEIAEKYFNVRERARELNLAGRTSDVSAPQSGHGGG